MRTASLSCLLVSSLIVACGKPSDNGPRPALSSNGAPAAAAQTTPAPPRAALADLDVAALKKKVGCVGETRRASCRILDEFEDAGRFAPSIPSGEGRWIGTAYTVEKGVEKSDLLLLSVVQVPTSTVPPGELALRIGTGPLPEDKRDHGNKLANALSRGDTVSKNNQALPYVKTWKPSEPQGAMNTVGTSLRLVHDEVYLRQSGVTHLLYVRVKPQAAPGGSSEATFAELWEASW